LSTRRKNCSEANISCQDDAACTRSSAIGVVALARIPQQHQNNLFTFRFGRQTAMRFSCLLIPVAGVSLVTLPTVEVGVNPGPIMRGDILSDLMGAGPIPFGFPPQRGQKRSKIGRWRALLERSSKIADSHALNCIP
jgi:hypothetical protein